MKKSALCVASCLLFSMHLAHADAVSTSNSGAVSGSTSTGIGQGGGSSLNNINTNSTSSVTGTSTSSSVGGLGVATASGGRSSAQGGTSNVSVNVQLAQASTPSTGTSSGSSTSPVSKAATDGPGTSAYDTRATVDYNQSSYSVRSTPSIGAPALTTTLSDTCMGSASFGLSITGFGATGGTTLVDQACVRRLDAREFRAMGLTDVALALLCQSDSNRRAVEATGHLCPGTTAPLAKTTPKAETSALTDDEKYQDPLIRQRMGLAPLGDQQYTAANKPEVKMAPIAPKEEHPLQKAEPIKVPDSIASRGDDVQTNAVPSSEVRSTPLVK